MDNPITLTRVFAKRDTPSFQINRSKSHYRSPLFFPLPPDPSESQQVRYIDILLHRVVVALLILVKQFTLVARVLLQLP